MLIVQGNLTDWCCEWDQAVVRRCWPRTQYTGTLLHYCEIVSCPTQHNIIHRQSREKPVIAKHRLESQDRGWVVGVPCMSCLALTPSKARCCQSGKYIYLSQKYLSAPIEIGALLNDFYDLSVGGWEKMYDTF